MKFKRWDLVDKHELKLMTLRVFLIGLCYSILTYMSFYFAIKK